MTIINHQFKNKKYFNLNIFPNKIKYISLPILNTVNINIKLIYQKQGQKDFPFLLLFSSIFNK